MLTDAAAIDLLHGLVSIPSLSRQEGEAAAWLAAQMAALGYARTFVDGAGNAVGEIGASDAAHTIVLLGHIDTVPGNIPVRIAAGEGGPVLYGRGSVDAKGPLATFAVAAARLGDGWARAQGVRIVVVGAVEEEAASSKGARFIRDRFDGGHEPTPAACVIGEPSGWQRVTLGYKGRLLVEIDAAQPMAHTAGPDAGVAVAAFELWGRVSDLAAQVNQGRERLFDQLQPSLRMLATETDEAMYDHVRAQLGVRLPPEFEVAPFARDLVAWAAEWVGAQEAPTMNLAAGQEAALRLEGGQRRLDLTLRGYEPAWRSERTTPIARSLLTAIRTEDPQVKPAFVVKTGTSDMNVVGPAWRCPIVAYGSGDSALDHTPQEHLSLDEYLRAVRILELAIRDFASFLQ